METQAVEPAGQDAQSKSEASEQTSSHSQHVEHPSQGASAQQPTSEKRGSSGKKGGQKGARSKSAIQAMKQKGREAVKRSGSDGDLAAQIAGMVSVKDENSNCYDGKLHCLCINFVIRH